MKIINRGLVSLDEIDAPEVLYKYRNFENPNHLSILSDQEIFFSPPTLFEDKFDCKIPVRFDLLTEEEIFEKYLFESKKTNGGWTRQQHRDWLGTGLKKVPLKIKKGLRK